MEAEYDDFSSGFEVSYEPFDISDLIGKGEKSAGGRRKSKGSTVSPGESLEIDRVNPYADEVQGADQAVETPPDPHGATEEPATPPPAPPASPPAQKEVSGPSTWLNQATMLAGILNFDFLQKDQKNASPEGIPGCYEMGFNLHFFSLL
jgi:hypothetical protein